MAELPYYTTIFPTIFSTMRGFLEAASSFWNLPGFRVQGPTALGPYLGF
jgi:hypothetical protein